MGRLTLEQAGALRATDLTPSGLAEGLFALLARMPGALGHIGYRKMKRRLQRRAETRFADLAMALGPEDVALDFGANVGDLAEMMSANGATVHAFEPEPDTFCLLQTRFRGRENVHLHNAAVSDFDGEAELVLPASFSDQPRSASKAASIAHDRYRTDGHVTRTTTVRDIRGILRGLDQTPSLVKMDIEGAELAVLDALQSSDLLSSDTALFVETHERMDPPSLPRIKRLQDWARSDCPAYLNLYWG